MVQADLNEAQRLIIEELGAKAEQRPTFPDGLAVGLRAELHDGLEATAALLKTTEQLFVNKFLLGQVLGCELKHIHEFNGPFAWSVPIARGTVAHKAIELSVHWRTTPLATELVDESLASLSHSSSPIADYLSQLPEPERAELRSEAVNSTQAFLDGWPPLRQHPQWRPAVEVRSRYELFEGKIVLQGKVDLSLGGPEGARAGRVLVDIKSGRRNRVHRDDLRFYALLETVRYGTPPRAVASYYLDESRLVSEPLTADGLWSAVRRTVDSVKRHSELVGDSDSRTEPRLRPSLGCRWCTLLTNCDTGQSFLNATDQDEYDISS